MPARTLVVVNPRSRNGALGRRWPVLEARLREHLGEGFEVERTRAPRDAERIAREGLRAGADTVIAVGGDGTASEVVSGALSAGLGAAPRVGLLPFGTGGDLARTLGVPADPEEAMQRLASGKTRRVDAGRARFRGRQGRERSVYFVNEASLGLSGLVTELVNAAPKALGGRVSFLVGTLRAVRRYRSRPVCVRVDGSVVHRGPVTLVAAANGRYFGGGMQVAPDARPDDGLLDVVIVRDVPTLRLVRQLPRIYRGAHLALPDVATARGARVEVSLEEPVEAGAAAVPAASAEPTAPGTGDVWIEVDGEPLGTAPALLEVVPGALEWLGA